MSTQTISLPRTPVFQMNWIISRDEDLTWFIGSSLVSYCFLGLLIAGFPLVPIYLFWMLCVDGPHVVATITRTYFDRRERKKLGLFLWIIVPAALLGPVMVMLGYAWLFFLFAVCWQHFHIAKQHFGFVMLYKAKNRERDKFDLHLDKSFLLTSLALPLLHFVIVTRPAIANLPGIQIAWDVALGAYLVFCLIYAGRQIQKVRAGIPLNGPKLILLLAVVPLHWLAFAHASQYSGQEAILRAGILVGLFHSFQYHRLIWFHNANRYSDSEAPARNGLAATLARRAAYYVATALSINLIFLALPGLLLTGSAMVQAAVWGIPFTHYMLDAKIWRVRGDRELAAALKM
jgi:hypothetical protein